MLSAESRVRLSAVCTAGTAPSLAGAENLTAVDLSHNQLSGALPALPPGVLTVDLSGNSFTGGVPASYGKGWVSTTIDVSDFAMIGQSSQRTVEIEDSFGPALVESASAVVAPARDAAAGSCRAYEPCTSLDIGKALLSTLVMLPQAH